MKKSISVKVLCCRYTHKLFLCCRYTNYFIGFIFCEFLNFAIVVGHFFLTDLFLNRRYLAFGFDIIEFYSLSYQKQRVCLPTCFKQLRNKLF